MAIKVLLKRKVPQDKAEALKALIDRLRSATAGRSGYVSGETLQRVDEPGECLVISKWLTRYDWEQWTLDPKRQEIQHEIDALLGEPAQYEIYAYE